MTFKVCAKIKSAGNASRKIMSQIMKSHLEILESSLFKKKCKKIFSLGYCRSIDQIRSLPPFLKNLQNKVPNFARNWNPDISILRLSSQDYQNLILKMEKEC